MTTEEVAFRLSDPGQVAAITCAAFSPDGALLAVGSYNRIAVWEVGKRQVRYVLEKPDGVGALDRLAFSPDGRLLAAVDGATLRVWDVLTGRAERALPLRYRSNRSVAFSPDGRLLAAGDKFEIRTWEVATWREGRSFHGHTGLVKDVEFSREGLLASASSDGTARTWDPRTGEPLLTLVGDHLFVESVSFSRDGRRLASTDDQGVVKVWDASSGYPALPLRVEEPRRAFAAVFSPAEDRLAVSTDYSPVVWDGERGEEFRTRGRLAWHRVEAGDCEEAGLWFAAAFHLGRLVEANPSDAGLRRRWDQARARRLGNPGAD